MIEVKDRIPGIPNRIKITPVGGGAPFYATWERADEPLEIGTPVNKALFDSIDEELFAHTALDDIEIDAQQVSIAADWTTVNFTRQLSGIPRVFVSASDTLIISVRNITAESCQIAARIAVTDTGFVANTSGGTVNKSVTFITDFDFAAATIDVLAVYDGGVTI